MARLARKLALLAAAAEAARRYAHKNPDKAGRFVDQAAQFVDKQTKGKYRQHVDGVARKAKGVAGIPSSPGYGTGPTSGAADFGSAQTRPTPHASTPPTVNPGSPTPTSPSGQPYPGSPSTPPGA